MKVQHQFKILSSEILTSFPVDRVIKPGVGIFSGSRFRSIRVGGGKDGDRRGRHTIFSAGFELKVIYRR